MKAAFEQFKMVWEWSKELENKEAISSVLLCLPQNQFADLTAAFYHISISYSQDSERAIA
jgi:hypothetical protein